MGITTGHDEQDAGDAESELASLWKPLSCKEEEEGWKTDSPGKKRAHGVFP